MYQDLELVAISCGKANLASYTVKLARGEICTCTSSSISLVFIIHRRFQF